MDDNRVGGGCIQYSSQTFLGLARGVSQILVGAVTVALLLYSLHTKFKDPHIMYSMFGFFLSVEAILITSVVSGWAARLKVRHRYFAHSVLQSCGLLSTIIGGVKAGRQFGVSQSAHCILGFLAMTMGLVQIITGPSALTLKRPFQIIHILFGIHTFVICSLCITTGLFKYSLKTWFGLSVTLILIFFVLFYTFYISIMSFITLVLRIRRRYDDDNDDIANEEGY